MTDSIVKNIDSLIGKIVKDNRVIKNGDVFIALKGENHDGHNYAQDAIEKGASLVIVEQANPNIPIDKQIIVEDTMKALEEIAKLARAKTTAKIIAITGSSGKTSTKEMLKIALEAQGKTYATVGNLNNLIGLPLTLANMDLDCDFVILELGMNHFGEIASMVKLALPDIALITNIGRAHHEFFPTSLDIAKAKAEIFLGTTKEGYAILPQGDFYDFLHKEASSYIDNILSFGEEGDFKLLSYNNGEVKAEIGELYNYTMEMKGYHQALNSVAVLGVVKVLGGELEKSIKAITKMQALKGRGEITKIQAKIGEITLIDDAYNANPDSMIAAIRSFGAMDNTYNENNKNNQNNTENKIKRKIAALGEMRELGINSEALHKELYPEVLKANIDKVYCCCENMKYLYNMLPPEKQGAWTEDSQSLWLALEKDIKNNDSILVKGSLGSNMLYIVNSIKTME